MELQTLYDAANERLAEARGLFGRVHYDLCMCGIPSHQMMAAYIEAFLSRTEAEE